MEFILRFLILPVSLVGSIVYCLIIRAVLFRWPQLVPVFGRLSLVALGLVGACAAMIFWPGPAYLVKHWDFSYTLFYQLCFLIGPLAVTTPIVAIAVKNKKGWMISFALPTVVCFSVCAFLIFADIFIYEAAYGPS